MLAVERSILAHTVEDYRKDTVNDWLKLEDEWKRNGYSLIEIPKSPF